MSTNRKYLDLNGLAYYHSKIISDIEHKIPEIPDIIVNLKLFATELRLGNKPIKYINTATENMAGLMSPNDVSKLKECLRFQYVDEIEHHEATINDFDPGELIAQSRDNLYKIYLDKVTDNGYNAYVIKQDENLNWKFVKIGSTSANEDFILKTSTGSQGLIYIKTDSFKVGSATGSIDLEIVEGDYPINLIGTDKINLYGNSLTLNGKNIVSKIGPANYFGNPGDTFTVNSSTPILRKKSDSEFYQVWDKSNLDNPLLKTSTNSQGDINIQADSFEITLPNNNYIYRTDDSKSYKVYDTGNLTIPAWFTNPANSGSAPIFDNQLKIDGNKIIGSVDIQTKLENYSPASNDFALRNGDTFQQAFAKLEGRINNLSPSDSSTPPPEPGTGEENVIETIKINGTALEPDDLKAVDITIPLYAGENGINITNDNKIEHSNKITGSQTSGLYEITFDSNGHIITAIRVTYLELANELKLYLDDWYAPNSNRTPTTNITISPSGTINLNDSNLTQQLTVTSDGTNNNVTWQSSDPSVAYVDESGLLTGISTGSVTITATLNNSTLESGIILDTVDVNVNITVKLYYIGTNDSNNFITTSNYLDLLDLTSLPDSYNVDNKYLYIISKAGCNVEVRDEINYIINLMTLNNNNKYTQTETLVNDTYYVYRSAQTVNGTVNISISCTD